MSKLLPVSALAAALSLFVGPSVGASGAAPLPLSDVQMDAVTAGFFRIDLSYYIMNPPQQPAPQPVAQPWPPTTILPYGGASSVSSQPGPSSGFLRLLSSRR